MMNVVVDAVVVVGCGFLWSLFTPPVSLHTIICSPHKQQTASPNPPTPTIMSYAEDTKKSVPKSKGSVDSPSDEDFVPPSDDDSVEWITNTNTKKKSKSSTITSVQNSDADTSSSVKGKAKSNFMSRKVQSSGVFPLSKYKVGGSDDKRETSFELSVVEDRKQKKTKSTIAASIDSDNDDEFAPADMDAAIANSILLLAADPQRLAVLPPLPTAINYTRLPIPEGQQLPQYTPSRYHHSSIPQTPIPAANTILTTIANVYRSSINYLERKLLMEYYLSIAKSFETNQPSHLVILIGGCITPGGGIALEAGTGAYIQCNPMGSPSYRFTYGALSRALPDCGMDLME